MLASMGQALDAAIPVTEGVQSVCELLGFEPLYLACEGRIVAVLEDGPLPRIC
jgi:hydrogenase expression/formation protein HypE